MKLLSWTVGPREPFFLIAGPCVIESVELCLEVASEMKRITERLGVPYVFKASFDKANRTSRRSFRGPGLEEGLATLARVRTEIGVPVLTDVHEIGHAREAASVVDVLQTPAFLVRQTDFLQDVASAGLPVNVKKGQFLAPWDMRNVVDKCREVGNERIMLCERGTSFGYNTLVTDVRALAQMRETGCPIVIDATHSVQQPGGDGTATGGQREMIPVVARAAVAAGVSGVFMETHPRPDEARSDGPNQWPLERMEELLAVLVEIDGVVKKHPYAEHVG